MEHVPDSFAASQEWFWLTHLQRDLHVIFARDRGSDDIPKGPNRWPGSEGRQGAGLLHVPGA